MPRDDFPERVKHLAAARTGYRCSNCGAHTSGPQAREDGALNLGEAAHISAAAPGGPRFDPSLSPEQRSSFSNAIWLCRICAKLIDNDVERFPRQLLVELKKRAEADAFADIGKPQTVLIDSLLDLKQAVKDAIAESGPSPTQFDAEIDSAVSNINQFRFEVAKTLLERLKEKHWAELSDRQRFRVLTNIAVTFLGEADRKRAAEGYRAAKRFQPDDQKAWENEALAHELLGEKSQAIQLARKIRARWPESARAVGIILAELPESTTIAQLESEIPAALAEEPEICMIMSRRAAALHDLFMAEKFARKALIKLPERAQAVLLVGQVTLGSLLAESWSKHAEIAIDRNSPRLAEAESYLTRAISLARNEKAYALEANALVTRSSLYEIKGEKLKSEQDIEQAYHVSPDEPATLAAYAAILHSRGDTERAIIVLRQAMSSSSSEEASFLLSDLLRQRGTKADLKEALSLLSDLAISESALTDGFRAHVVSCAMYIAKELDDFEKVDQLLDRIPEGALSPSALRILGIRLALAHGQQEQANKLADEVLKVLPEDASADDRRNLAMVLSQLSRFEDALPLWRQIAPLNALGSDTKHLLDCAMRTERHGVVLDVCKSLRTAGVNDPELFAAEMTVLERYAPEEALELLRSQVLKRPDDRLLQLHLSILGLRLNRPEVVVSSIAEMPPADSVSPRHAMLAVAVLRSHGDPNDSVRYAYEVLRLHFGDVDAHRAYVSAMGPGEHTPDIPGYERVTVGCAVRFVVENSSGEQWTIIEDCADPDPSRNEISPDSTLAKELLGKRVGDSFRMSAFSHGTVKEITSKFIFRYQDCGKHWQFRFSDKPEILSFQVGKTGTFEGDFEPILTMMRARRERVEEVERLYSTNLVPIHIVAAALGVNDFEALAGLASNGDVLIRCCDGSQLEREVALKVLNDHPKIVLDITAIGTLILLDRLSF